MKHILSFLIALLVSLLAQAVPARRGTFTVTQSDGSQITLRLVGDEFQHYFVNTATNQKMLRGEDGDFYVIDESTLAEQTTQASQRRQAANIERIQRLNKRRTNTSTDGRRKVGAISGGITGKKKGIVILVNFADVSFNSQYTQSTFDDMFNKVGYSDNNHIGSVHDYFYDQSYKQFDLTFDVVGPVTLGNNMAYYGGNNSAGSDLRPAQMAKEACQKADNLGVDFSKYDWDNDGYVDQVFIIYAGYGENYNGSDENTIWPHEWDLVSAGIGVLTVDGVKVKTYACCAELCGTKNTNLNGIGTACHEFSHCLGYPDSYDTDYSGGIGMDSYDVMCGGSYNGPNGRGEVPAGYTAYERWTAGWMEPTELTTAQNINNMADLGTEGVAYIMKNPANSEEFFLLENRQAEKWFKYFDNLNSGHGLFITYIDYNATVWNNNKPNDNASHQRLTWIPADGNYGTYSSANKSWSITNTDVQGDFFPGTNSVTSFTNSSHTSVYGKWNTGTSNNFKSVTDITERDGKISFKFDGGITDDGSRYTITYNAGTGSCTTDAWTQTEYKESTTLPICTITNNEWEFIGWSTNNIDITNTKPTIKEGGSTFIPTTDCTLYAVYKHTEEGTGASGSYALDWAEEAVLQAMTLSYGKQVEYTATDGSQWVVKTYKNTGMQINGGKDASIKVPECPAAITSIDITCAPAQVLKFSETDYTGSNTPTVAASSSSSTTPKIDLNEKNLNTGYIYTTDKATIITKVVVNYGTSGVVTYATSPSIIPLTTPTIAFASSQQSMLLGDPERTISATVKGSTGAITYTSSKPSVATVDASSGKIVTVGLGTTTITATVAPVSGVSRSASTSYTLNVTMPKLVSIAATTVPTQTTYWEEESFDQTGLVITASYENGYQSVIESGYTMQPSTTDLLNTSDTEIQISYTEGSVTKSTTVPITVNAKPKYTVTFEAGNGSCETASLTETAYQSGVELPTATSSIEDWEFVGWTTSPVTTEVNVSPTILEAGSTYKPEQNTTLYAVYSYTAMSTKDSYTLASDIEKDCQYILISTNQAGTGYCVDAANLSSTAATKINGTKVTLTADGGLFTISDVPGTAIWTADIAQSKLTLKNDDNYLKINGGGISLYSSISIFWSTSYGLYGKSNSGNNSYYLQPSNSSFTTTSTSGNSSKRVYAFKKNTVTTTYTSYPRERSVADLTQLIEDASQGKATLEDIQKLVSKILKKTLQSEQQ